ncbi:DUF6176 family protein [Lacticaseibacillus mingshuiensis]|uniref:DUF6176 family protein n=1 Tax=Lacticaseibacillus mingshuiensis TaxID=2799574 RepID=UPI001CEC60AC|nr:DUF6176 family protein [Lacticaseibacillus mingshuiensis]
MIELEGFAVKSDKRERAREWMRFLRKNQSAVDATLAGEHLRVEQIFSFELAGRLYLCWYTNGEDGGADVTASAASVDRMHVAFWQECIDESVPSIKFALENSFRAQP